MTNKTKLLFICAVLSILPHTAAAADLLTPACRALIPPTPIAADIPSNKLENQYWQQQYTRQVEQAKQQRRNGTIFLGDSITNRWPAGLLTQASPVQPVLNLGLEGDKTQELLWRLINGNFLASHPHFVVLLIGTNNKDSANEIAAGIASILLYIRQNSPGTKILVIGIYPRDPWEEYKEKITAINNFISLCQSPFIQYSDYTHLLMESDDTLKDEMYQNDHLHLTGRAYTQLAPTIRNDLAHLDAQH